jgi:hypothetical protein
MKCCENCKAAELCGIFDAYAPTACQKCKHNVKNGRSSVMCRFGCTADDNIMCYYEPAETEQLNIYSSHH